jgi:hypothetical protein
MDKHETPSPAPPRTTWADLGLLVLLLVLVVALRAWQMTHTEVMARDSIGYVRIAWQMEHGDWRAVVRAAPQHPGYPLSVLAVALPVRRWLVKDDLPYAMQLSAQLASATASVLLVIPTFLLGRALFNQRVGFWATLLFQCLPSAGRLMGDGLSEPLFLLWASAAFLFSVRALRDGSLLGFVLAGLSSGLAYLTRPEGLLIALATGAVLLGMQAARAWRRPWKKCVEWGVGLALGCLVVAGPYVLLIGGITVKLTAREVLKTAWRKDRLQDADPRSLASSSGVATGRPPLASWWPGSDSGSSSRARWGLWTLTNELIKGFFYVLWVPALWGQWRFRDRFRVVPGAWVLLLVGLAVGFLLYRVAVVAGYLSDRHALLIILPGCYWAVAAILHWGDGLATALARLRPALAGTVWTNGRLWSGLLLTAFAGVALGKTLEPLHVNRLGFRQAGYWLAENANPGDEIVDAYCWSHYYAGRVFLEGTTEPLPAHQPPVCYVVLERSSNNHARHEEQLAAARGLAEKGHMVFSWTAPRAKDKAEIVVFEVPR